LYVGDFVLGREEHNFGHEFGFFEQFPKEYDIKISFMKFHLILLSDFGEENSVK